MELKDTVALMISCDYRQRFLAEYNQLHIRIESLERTLRKYNDGTLNFELTCSYDLLNAQLQAMKMYRMFLKERAIIEKI